MSPPVRPWKLGGCDKQRRGKNRRAVETDEAERETGSDVGKVVRGRIIERKIYGMKEIIIGIDKFRMGTV